MKGLLYSMLSLTGLLMLPSPLSAGAPSDSIPADERLNIRHDCTIYDSIIASWRETNMNDAFENFTQDYINLDTANYIEAVTPFTDAEYQARLRGIVSPIRLPYNQIVRKHLVAYVTTHRALTRRMLGQSQYYFPLVERELRKPGCRSSSNSFPLSNRHCNPPQPRLPERSAFGSSCSIQAASTVWKFHR